MRISGQCLCGAVRYRGEADPMFQVKCYCTDCRRSSAAGHAARNAAMPQLIFIRASTLDDPNLFSPQLAVWAARAPAWDRVPEGLPTFAERPMNRS